MPKNRSADRARGTDSSVHDARKGTPVGPVCGMILWLLNCVRLRCGWGRRGGGRPNTARGTRFGRARYGFRRTSADADLAVAAVYGSADWTKALSLVRRIRTVIISATSDPRESARALSSGAFG